MTTHISSVRDYMDACPDDCPWIYCDAELVASPEDVLCHGPYMEYLRNRELLDLPYNRILLEWDWTPHDKTYIYLNKCCDERCILIDEIDEKIMDMMYRYDLTKQQSTVYVLVNMAKLHKSSVARLLHIYPQNVHTICQIVDKKIQNKK